MDQVTAILNKIKWSLDQEFSLYLHFTISFSIQWQGITPKSCLFRLYGPTLMDSTLCVHVRVCVRVCVCVYVFLSHVQLYVTLWAIACQALSMEFSSQEC